MATLGYGDISPALTITPSLAILQAPIGCFYMAVVVASLVGISTTTRRRWPPPSHGIETKLQALAEASAPMAQKAYEQAAADAGAEGGATDAGSAGDEGVVDAEFEEVKDDDQKSA